MSRTHGGIVHMPQWASICTDMPKIHSRIYMIDPVKYPMPAHSIKSLFFFAVILCAMIFYSGSTVWAKTALEAVDYLSGTWDSASPDGQYVYGTSLNRYFERMDSNGNNTVLRDFRSYHPNYTVQYTMATSTPNLVFSLVKLTIDNTYYLFKSVDGGENFGNNAPNYDNGNCVLRVGWDADGWEGNGWTPTHIPDVRLLTSSGGWCEITHPVPGQNGLKTSDLLFGEYNVSSIVGADQYRILKSSDDGDTWEVLMTWTKSGHIHNIKQDPFSGFIYVLTGDYSGAQAIIRWDGAGAWPSADTLPVNFPSSGFKVAAGLQRHRSVGIVFTESNVFTMSDTHKSSDPAGTEVGIWRWSKDLSMGERVCNQGWSYDPQHVGWAGVNFNGTLVFTTSAEYIPGHDLTTPNTLIYVSTDQGASWYPAAVVNTLNNLKASKWNGSLIQAGNRLYFTLPGTGAGKTYLSTVVLSTDSKDNDELPVVVHPVYWVGPWEESGSDTNKGWSPRTPWATLAHALTREHIVPGARVRVAPGNYSEDGIIPDWDNAYRPGSGKVIVVGAGPDRTFIEKNSRRRPDYLFGIKGNVGVFEYSMTFQNIALLNTQRYETSNVLNLMEGSQIELINCSIGDINSWAPLVDINANENSNTRMRAVRSDFIQSPRSRGNFTHVSFSNSGGEFSAKYCMFMNGYVGIGYGGPGSVLSLLNCVFYNYRSSAVTIYNSAERVPTIRNCIFKGNGIPLKDESNLIETDNDIDYNCYYKSNLNIQNFGGVHSIFSAPSFVNENAWDFRLMQESPCIDAGDSVGATEDFLGNKVPVDGDHDGVALPDMGCFENP